MKRFSALLSNIFGYLLLLLCVLVVVETIGRKWLRFSLQGVDELGGYILAITTGLSFTIALIHRSHIRIDLAYDRMGFKTQVWLDWISLLLLSALAALLFYVGLLTLIDTIEFNSTAPTPWATPLIWPQSVWLTTLAFFLLTSIIKLINATRLLIKQDLAAIQKHYGLKVASEELQEELASFEERTN